MRPLSLFKQLKHGVKLAGLSPVISTPGPLALLRIAVGTFARQ